MEALAKAVPIAMLTFVVSSMLAVGLSLTVREIVTPLRNGKLLTLAVLANFVLMPLAAILIARVFQLAQPLGVALLILGVAAGAPFLPKLAGIAEGNLAFAVGLMAHRALLLKFSRRKCFIGDCCHRCLVRSFFRPGLRRNDHTEQGYENCNNDRFYQIHRFFRLENFTFVADSASYPLAVQIFEQRNSMLA